MINGTIFEILENGNLKISLTSKGREFILDNHNKISIDGLFLEIIEDWLCNGYNMVEPERIGALTESFIISDGIIDEETSKEDIDNTTLWWFPAYMIISEIEELLSKGYVIYRKYNN